MMMQSMVPGPEKLSDDLAQRVFMDCGYKWREGRLEYELLVAVVPVVVLGMIGPMTFRKLADACWCLSMRQSHFKGLLEELKGVRVVEAGQFGYRLAHPPVAEKVSEWLAFLEFAEFRQLIESWSAELLRPVTMQSGIGSMRRSQVDMWARHAPAYFTLLHMCRILRLLGHHESAFRILQKCAPNAGLVTGSGHGYESWSRSEVQCQYYHLLGHTYEPVISQPVALRTEFLGVNIARYSLYACREDEMFTDRDAVLNMCRKSEDETLLYAVVFRSLQKGEWEPIRVVAKRTRLYGGVQELAEKLIRWTEKQSWGALRGLLKLVQESSEALTMFLPFVALALRVQGGGLTNVCRAALSCSPLEYGDEVEAMRTGVELLCYSVVAASSVERLPQSPIGAFFIGLSLLGENQTGMLSREYVKPVVEACMQLHERGLGLYAWVLASLALSQSGIEDKKREVLQAIVEARQDIPALPGVKIFTSQDDLVLEKFLALSKEVASTDNSEGQQQGRMEWCIYLGLRGEVRDVEPIFRKMTAKGTLTAGRKAGLASIKEGKYDDCLTSADNDVLKELKFNYSWDGCEEYYFTKNAVAYLCGHPYIRLISPKHITHEEVSLELLHPRLQILSKGKQVSITMPDDVCSCATICHIAGNRYGLRMPSDAEYKMHRLITEMGRGGKLRLPEKGGTAVMDALVAMAGQFQLCGDLHVAQDNLPVVEAQRRLVVSLRGQSGRLTGSVGVELLPGTEIVRPGKGDAEQVVQYEQKKVLLRRDLQQELIELISLLRDCPTLQAHLSSSQVLQPVEDVEAALDILGELHDVGAERVELRWPEGQALSLHTVGAASFRLKSNAESGAERWLKIGGDVVVDESCVVRFTEFLDKVRQSAGRYICLGENQYVRLSKAIAKQTRLLSQMAMPADGGGRTRKSLALSPAGIALLAVQGADGELPAALEPSVQKVREVMQAYQSEKVPSTLRAELRDYQLLGYRWLMQRLSAGMGACLADDMGLGKTVQVLAVLLAKAKEGASLVLAPASVCANWVHEGARFAPSLRMVQFRQHGREELLAQLGARDVLVCSYGLFVNMAEDLCSRNWNVTVLDEAQSIKNSQSRRAEHVRSLQTRHRIAATGTPLENNLLELWSLMEFLNTGYLGARSSFLSRFKDRPAHLRTLIAPFVLRRLKSDVLDELPEKNEQVLYVDLSEQERALYEALRRKALVEMNGETDRFHVLAHLTRMRRMCCHPRLGSPDCELNSSSKMEALRELLSELRSGGHKALIFSQFTDVLTYAKQVCDGEGFSSLYLDGSTPTAARAALVETFQQGEVDFFFISLKAGGVGLNLTAANYVVLLDPWWNPATEDQAADRAHRMGQSQKVTVCRLVCADTIEQRVLELHARKREMVDAVLSDSTEISSALSVDELLQLVR